VLLGVPSLRDNDRYHGYLASALERIEAALSGVNHDVFVTGPTQQIELAGVVEADNVLVDKFLAGDYDYLWMVELDVQVPSDSFEKLLGLGVDIACGYARRHSGEGLICGFLDENMRVWYLPLNAVEGKILSGWVMAGTSCVLISRRVFEGGIRFRYVRGVSSDIVFMFDAQRSGFSAKVHGDVLCGHLPEWPIESLRPNVLDVGCGHKPKGDVNIDLHPEPSAHRCVDQRVNDDVRLDTSRIPNFVKADGCHLPFRDGAVNKSVSWHLIEHLPDPEGFLRELMRVSTEEIEVHCPNGGYLSCKGPTKPLHLHDFSAAWFRQKLASVPEWDFLVKWDYSQSEPWEIVVEGFKR